VHLVDEEDSRRPCACAADARSTASRMSLTPPSTADMAMNWASKASAIRRASVVLPVPGGPQRIIEWRRPDANATRKGLPGPSRCCWPITWSSVFGRSRSASGAAPEESAKGSSSEAVGTAERSAAAGVQRPTDSARAASAVPDLGHKMRARSPRPPACCMTRPTFAAISSVLTDKFKVDADKVQPGATLEHLGLDSLALMEFVFALEDRFDVRIPEDRLDPRQAGVTLEHLAQLIDEAVAARPGSDAAAV
jgi:acyl carrier protein